MKLVCLCIGILLVPVTTHGAQAPSVKIYEFNGREITLLDSTPNTDLLIPANQENITERYLVLQCKAPYPIQWIYSGDGIPEYIANTSVSWAVEPHEFTASAGIFRLSEYHTGNYTCKSIQNSNWAVSYYLYITGDNLFTANGGESIAFSKNDESVRIPCSVSNPHVRVTLQKLIGGYVNCPLNDTVRYDRKRGFILRITDDYQPEGDYLCIASYRGQYKFVQYLVLSENESMKHEQNDPNGHGDETHMTVPPMRVHQQMIPKPKPATPKPLQTTHVSYPNKPTDIPSSPVKDNTCDSFPCGRYAYCQLNANDQPVCKCERHFHGDPYDQCHPECVVDDDCPSNRACQDNACEDPCPSACGPPSSVQSCKVVNHTTICNYNNCNPSPCGPHSKCEDLTDKAVCSCLPGFVGKPPHCSPNPTTTLSIRTTLAQATSLKPTEAVIPESPAGFDDEDDLVPSKFNCRSQRDCPVTLRCMDNKCKDPCSPNPCGRSTICRVSSHEPICTCAPGFIKVNQYCLPTNCRSQRDCPENKSCVRNKCINPCAGYCGHNSECTVQLHVARCDCTKGFEGNPFQGCTRMKLNADLGMEAVQVKLVTPAPTPGVIQKVPLSPTCGLCGRNAKCISNSCKCNVGFSGDPYRFCYQVIAIPESAILDKDEIAETDLGFLPESSTSATSGTKYLFTSTIPASKFFSKSPSTHTKYTMNTTGTKLASNTTAGTKLPTNTAGTRYGTFTAGTKLTGPVTLNDGPQKDQGTKYVHKMNGSQADTKYSTNQYQNNGNTKYVVTSTSDMGTRVISQSVQTPMTSTSAPKNSTTTSFSYGFSSTLPTIIKKGYDCLKSEDCPKHKSCLASKCLDPCMFFPICGENQACQVVHHKASCVCKEGFPVKIYNNCYPAENYTSLALCNPNPCGPNEDCNITDSGSVCRCKSGMIGYPPNCQKDTSPKLKCELSSQCNELLACINGVCDDPCENSCGYLARCRVYKHQAKCFCPQGFYGNPRVSCSAPLYNTRFSSNTEPRHAPKNANSSEVTWDDDSFETLSDDGPTETVLDVTEIVKVDPIGGSQSEEKDYINVPLRPLRIATPEEEKKRESIARHDDEYFDDSNEFPKLFPYHNGRK
ncbi:unnamed protein product [Allacma fusca]|uniref:Uncharacterized protein n=1 Tax=Allacma fusca TaxID=39272 RepID=A0A8J2L1W9_9HEXA|nr:unnamed protein product [Allacma fusca]